MIIKTSEFNTQFYRDIQLIKINNNKKLREKGSYKRKTYGSYITDIDITEFVHYNKRLFGIVYNILNKIKRNNSKFNFIKMSCGDFQEFQLPWKFDSEGGCNFNLQEATKWYTEFSKKNLIDSESLENIKKNLFLENIKIKNIINIENILHTYSEIIWYEEDIKRGYIQYNGNIYKLLDIIKYETPVLEFLYEYKKDEMISVDYGLVDYRYSKRPLNNMYRYYEKDFYNIIKSFDWKLEKKYKYEFLSVMKNVEKLISFRHQIKLLHNLKKSKNINKYLENKFRKKIEELLGYNIDKYTLKKLTDKINNQMEIYGDYFYKNLQNKYKSKYILYSKRGIESQKSVNIEDIQQRIKDGIKCPFFSTDIDDFKKIQNFAKKICIDSELITECFVKIAKKHNITISKLLISCGCNNKLSLIIKDDKIILFRNNNKIDIFPKMMLKKLQRIIILY